MDVNGILLKFDQICYRNASRLQTIFNKFLLHNPFYNEQNATHNSKIWLNLYIGQIDSKFSKYSQ